jgi:hypothetical protein
MAGRPAKNSEADGGQRLAAGKLFFGGATAGSGKVTFLVPKALDSIGG